MWSEGEAVNVEPVGFLVLLALGVTVEACASAVFAGVMVVPGGAEAAVFEPLLVGVALVPSVMSNCSYNWELILALGTCPTVDSAWMRLLVGRASTPGFL